MKKLIREIKRIIGSWWFREVIRPYMRRHKVTCAQDLRDVILTQMWRGGVGYTNMNKWLVMIGSPTIVAYGVDFENKVEWFFREASSEELLKFKSYKRIK